MKNGRDALESAAEVMAAIRQIREQRKRTTGVKRKISPECITRYS